MGKDDHLPEKLMHKLIIAAALLAACAGCNTVAGFGKDLQAIGGAVAGTAEGAENGTAKPVTRDPAACLPDSHGRLPDAACSKTN
jgi:predicted small secreted protein